MLRIQQAHERVKITIAKVEATDRKPPVWRRNSNRNSVRPNAGGVLRRGLRSGIRQQLVFSKKELGRFPNAGEVLDLIKKPA